MVKNLKKNLFFESFLGNIDKKITRLLPGYFFFKK